MWNINVKIGIIRGLKKLRQNYLPNVLWKMKWNTANMPLTYMTEITLVLFSHQNRGWFSISRTSYDTDFHKIQQSFQGSHFCFCHFYKEGSEKQERENKKKQVSFIGFIFLNLRENVCQSIGTKIAGLLSSLAPGRVSGCAFRVISILHGCLLSAGAINLL